MLYRKMGKYQKPKGGIYYGITKGKDLHHR